MEDMRRIDITAEEADAVRVDKALADRLPDMSRSFIAKLIDEGHVTVNGKPSSRSTVLKTGDKIVITLPQPVSPEAEPEDIPLDIVYEDSAVIVVNKPQGMVVHPAAGNTSGTLVNALLYHCGDSLSGINGVQRPGIVHRIDKGTSGLLMVAKTDEAHKRLAEQIKAHTFTREYEAVVIGRVKAADGTVNAPIGRHKIKRKQMAVTAVNSKPAVTHYHVLAYYDGYTHMRLRLETGRTHQIRVHMAYIGHPVAGDPVYSKRKIPGLKYQCLHAKKIGFIHPVSGEYMEFETELPKYFQKFLNSLRRVYGEGENPADF